MMRSIYFTRFQIMALPLLPVCAKKYAESSCIPAVSVL